MSSVASTTSATSRRSRSKGGNNTGNNTSSVAHHRRRDRSSLSPRQNINRTDRSYSHRRSNSPSSSTARSAGTSMRSPPPATSLVNAHTTNNSGNSHHGSSHSHHGPLNSSSSSSSSAPNSETAPLSQSGGGISISPAAAALVGRLCPKSARLWLHQARTNKLSTALASVALIFLLATIQVDDDAASKSSGGMMRGTSVANTLSNSLGLSPSDQAENGAGGLQKALNKGMGQLQSDYRAYLSLPPPKTSALGAFRGSGLSPTGTTSASLLLPPGQSPVKYFMPHLAPITEPVSSTDTPIFFHIPRAGTSIKSILSGCLGLIMATDAGTRNGHDRDRTAKIVNMAKGGRYVNVDTTTLPGLQRAGSMGLIQSQLADVVVTPHVYTAVTSLFDDRHKARMFTTVRHPIDRAVSMFHYLSVADWEPTYDPDLAFVNIEMYARSERAENNWMIRFLTGEIRGDLTERHLDVAKEILRHYCLVGLMEDKAESLRRFEAYFGFSYRSAKGRDCRDKYLHWDYGNRHAHPKIEEGSAAWQLLYRKNELDIRLYEYALEVFKEQGQLFQPGGMYYREDIKEQQEGTAVVEASANDQGIVVADMPAPEADASVEGGAASQAQTPQVEDGVSQEKTDASGERRLQNGPPRLFR